MIKIKDLLKEENTITEQIDVLLTEKLVQQTKSGKDYLTCKAVDKSGEILFRVWDVNDALDKVLTVGVGMVLDIVGKPYNGALSFELAKHSTPSLTGKNPNDYKMSFLPDIEGMKNYLKQKMTYVMEDKQLAVVLKELMQQQDLFQKFLYYPAAESMHHAEDYGLLFHTTSILHHAESLIPSTELCYSCTINHRLVYLAIILHDFYKTKEYNQTESGRGELNQNALIGHIGMSVQFVGSLYYRGLISEELNLQLSHILGAHHGKHEWGAMVVPCTYEAMLVHACDYYDSRIYMMKDAMIKLDEGEYSKTKSFGLDGARIYCPKSL